MAYAFSKFNKIICNLLYPTRSSLAYKLTGPLRLGLARIWDFRLRATRPVFRNGKYVFSMADFGTFCRYRSSGFEKKEPETLEWIESFDAEDSLLDIGANVGTYSLYAATLGHRVLAFEASPFNYCMLMLNIDLNNVQHLITPFLVPAHDSLTFSSYNVSNMTHGTPWGDAQNTFDNTRDDQGNDFIPISRYYLYGDSIDNILREIPSVPTHIKIDVDGNELTILKGAIALLQNPSVKSLLVELEEKRNDYKESIELIESCGFKLIRKWVPDWNFNGERRTMNNHIFFRQDS